jgi:hypothetical protein
LTTILQFITNFRLGKQPWKGKTTVSFVSYFVEQKRLDDKLTHTQGPPLNDTFKRAMLDNAVQGIEDLQQVRITQATLCQQLSKIPTFSEYLDWLTNTATIYDDHQQQGNAVCTQRKPPTLALLMTIIWIMTVLMYSKTMEQPLTSTNPSQPSQHTRLSKIVRIARLTKWTLTHGYPTRYLPDSAWMISAHGCDLVQTSVV